MSYSNRNLTNRDDISEKQKYKGKDIVWFEAKI